MLYDGFIAYRVGYLSKTGVLEGGCTLNSRCVLLGDGEL